MDDPLCVTPPLAPSAQVDMVRTALEPQGGLTIRQKQIWFPELEPGAEPSKRAARLGNPHWTLCEQESKVLTLWGLFL